MFTNETQIYECENCRNNGMQSECSCSCNNIINNCKCGFDDSGDPSIFPVNYMYGQSYVPIQYMNRIFTPEEALENGTLFPELVSPYRPYQSIEEIEYIKATNNIGRGCNNQL